MKWKETHQDAARESSVLDVVAVKPPTTAREYAKRMVELRYQGWGDEKRALEDIAGRCRMTPRSLKRLISGETKEATESVTWRVRSAYLAFCQRLISHLENEVRSDLERYGKDAGLGDIADDVAALQAKVRAAREALDAARK